MRILGTLIIQFYSKHRPPWIVTFCEAGKPLCSFPLSYNQSPDVGWHVRNPFSIWRMIHFIIKTLHKICLRCHVNVILLATVMFGVSVSCGNELFILGISEYSPSLLPVLCTAHPFTYLKHTRRHLLFMMFHGSLQSSATSRRLRHCCHMNASFISFMHIYASVRYLYCI